MKDTNVSDRHDGDTNAGDTNDSNENFFGLVRYDGSRKPAYDVFKQIIRE